MTSPKPSPATTIHLTRTFPAPRERVFRAWTDPEELKRWWGPEGYDTPIAEVDLKVGGKYRLGMRKLPDGELFYLSGRYLEVQAPEKLVYTWRWEKTDMHPGETRVTVEFSDRGETTEIVLTHEMFPGEKERDQHNAGWNGCLDRLAKAL